MPEDTPMSIDAYLERNKAEIRVNSAKECLELLRRFTGLEPDEYHIGAGRGPRYLYRGHEKSDYSLHTTLDRYAGARKRQAEDITLREFRRRMHQYLPAQSIPRDDLETLALMQHFGVPTRLLDVTRSPYIALYFAVRDVLKATDAAVWAFYCTNMRTVSLKRVFSAYPDLGKRIGRFYDPRLAFAQNELLAKLFMADAVFSDPDEPQSLTHHEIVLDVEPFAMNPSLTVQQGLFLVSGSPTKTFEDTLVSVLEEIEGPIRVTAGSEPSATKIVIPARLRAPLMRHLEKMGITAATMVGGLEGFAVSLREKITSMDRDDFLGDLMGMPT
jgi:hypothetical protein